MPALHHTNILGDSSGSGRFADFFGGLAMVFDYRCVPWACALVDLRRGGLASVSLPLASSFGKAGRGACGRATADHCSFGTLLEVLWPPQLTGGAWHVRIHPR